MDWTWTDRHYLHNSCHLGGRLSKPLGAGDRQQTPAIAERGTSILAIIHKDTIAREGAMT